MSQLKFNTHSKKKEINKVFKFTHVNANIDTNGNVTVNENGNGNVDPNKNKIVNRNVNETSKDPHFRNIIDSFLDQTEKKITVKCLRVNTLDKSLKTEMVKKQKSDISFIDYIQCSIVSRLMGTKMKSCRIKLVV